MENTIKWIRTCWSKIIYILFAFIAIDFIPTTISLLIHKPFPKEYANEIKEPSMENYYQTVINMWSNAKSISITISILSIIILLVLLFIIKDKALLYTKTAATISFWTSIVYIFSYSCFLIKQTNSVIGFVNILSNSKDIFEILSLMDEKLIEVKSLLYIVTAMGNMNIVAIEAFIGSLFISIFTLLFIYIKTRIKQNPAL